MMPWLITLFVTFVAILVLAGYRRRANGLVASLRDEHQIELRTMETDNDARLRRLGREHEATRHDVRDALIHDLLPALDSLDNGISATADQEVRKGLGLVRTELVKALDRQGVEIYQPHHGDAFDPQLHEAVDIVDEEALPPGAVHRALRAGARSRDRVLRPALVAVNRATAPSEEVVLDLAEHPSFVDS